MNVIDVCFRARALAMPHWPSVRSSVCLAMLVLVIVQTTTWHACMSICEVTACELMPERQYVVATACQSARGSTNIRRCAPVAVHVSVQREYGSRDIAQGIAALERCRIRLPSTSTLRQFPQSCDLEEKRADSRRKKRR